MAARRSPAGKPAGRPPAKKPPAKNSRSKSAAAAKQAAAERERYASGRRQLWAVLLFAAAAFLLFATLMKGQNAWLAIHNFLLGIFGVTAFIWPVLLGYVAVLCAADKIGKVGGKVLESGVLIVLIGAAVDIFSRSTDAAGFLDSLGSAYKAGPALKGGGLLGSLIGWPLSRLFGRVGAGIIVVLLIFVFFMLVTGTTLIMLFRALYKPVRTIERQAADMYAQRWEREEQRRAEAAEAAEAPRFNIDVPIDDLPAGPKEKPKPVDIETSRKNLLDTYRELDDDQPAAPPKKGRRKKSPPAAADPDVLTTGKKPPFMDEGVLDKFKGSTEERAPWDDVPLPEKDAIPLEKTGAKPAAVPLGGTRTATPAEKPKGPGSETFIGAFQPPAGSGITVESPRESYCFPPINLLAKPAAERSEDISEELKSTASRLVDTLRSFGVETRIIDISRGPSVTRYELQPAAGVKISKITNLADDIALNLATAGVRIEAPIPNKPAVGIEVPNKVNSMVGEREIIDSEVFRKSKSPLTVALGRDIAGQPTVADIAKMPHGLIAGATGSGKSVCINSFVVSLMYKATPDQVKFLMIDPKVVELGIYNGIPHLLVPVVTDPRKAAGALGWAVTEMEKRYKLFADNNVRDLSGYNRLAEKEEGMLPMPHIVIIIDELADLMMVASNEVEDSICRIAQKARAAGMHLIIATQRPSVNVVTGLIKANVPTRIAFAVSSQIDSRTILDMGGAEKLMGRGDMLFYP
ncbi:MAG: DNA translocase FtsK, partial [Clostridiales bacterium]|nr:DNA translocase FtsK [Clostridiales bacterium]